MPGGFHPFHAGHAALYQSAVKAFPNADVYVAATNDTKTRPFPFAIKEKLAKLAGVAQGHFIQVKSPFKSEEITSHYNPNEDVLIFVRSEKDKTEQPKPGGTKKDGSPAYFQPWTGKNLQPFSKHAYIAYLPTVEFGPGIKSATEIRNAWPKLDDRRKTAMVMSLYPVTQTNPKLAANVVKMLDIGMGEQLNEFAPSDSGDNGEEDILLKFARMWYNGDLATQQKIEQALERYGWEIGELESEEGGAFVIRAGDEHGDSYIGFSADDLMEGAPIVVAQAPIDVRNPKKAPQPQRYMGDIVPPTKPPSTEKRGVKGRPGQRPMPTYEGAGLSVEELAHISDKALDDAYHYGRSTPGANFGWMANLQSAKAAKRLIDAGETDIEAISDAIHKGWNITAAADYKGQLQLDTPTPEEKKLKRAKLAMQSYSQLPEEEKEKDRVVARAMLAALGKTNVSESTDYLDEK